MLVAATGSVIDARQWPPIPGLILVVLAAWVDALYALIGA